MQNMKKNPPCAGPAGVNVIQIMDMYDVTSQIWESDNGELCCRIEPNNRWKSIDFSKNTAQYNISSSDGGSYTISLGCQLSASNVASAVGTLQEAREKRFLVRICDKGGKWWTFGCKETPARFTWGRSVSTPQQEDAYNINLTVTQQMPLLYNN